MGGAGYRDGMQIWIMLIEDRHADTDAIPFGSEQAAIAAARARAGHDGVGGREMTDDMREDGWVLNCPISEEGDRIRVIQRTMSA